MIPSFWKRETESMIVSNAPKKWYYFYYYFNGA